MKIEITNAASLRTAERAARAQAKAAGASWKDCEVLILLAEKGRGGLKSKGFESVSAFG